MEEGTLPGTTTSGAAAKETQPSQIENAAKKLWSMYESLWELQDQLAANGVFCGLAAPLLNLLPQMGADDQITHLERLIGRMKDLLLRQIQHKSNVAAAAVQPAAASDSGSETVRGKEVYATFELPAGRQSSDSPGKPGKRKRPSESGSDVLDGRKRPPRPSSSAASAFLALARRANLGDYGRSASGSKCFYRVCCFLHAGTTAQ